MSHKFTFSTFSGNLCHKDLSLKSYIQVYPIYTIYSMYYLFEIDNIMA